MAEWKKTLVPNLVKAFDFVTGVIGSVVEKIRNGFNAAKVIFDGFFDENGDWIMIACDQAVFLPMMHMSVKNKEKLLFFPRVCYHYSIDLDNPNLFSNDRSLKQKASGEWIRERGFVND